MRKRSLQFFVILLTATVMMGAGSSSTRFDKLGHKLMCTCSCGEILLECNHMGCPDSPVLIDKLRTRLAAGASDHDIFQAFEKEYGAIVLAAPIRGGFDLVAWIVPFAVLAIGGIGITWLLRHWRDRHRQTLVMTSPAGAGNAAAFSSDHLRDRIRRETNYDA